MISVALHYQHSQWRRQKRRVEDACKVSNRRVLSNESLHYSENTIIISDSAEYERLACLHLEIKLSILDKCGPSSVSLMQSLFMQL